MTGLSARVLVAHENSCSAITSRLACSARGKTSTYGARAILAGPSVASRKILEPSFFHMAKFTSRRTTKANGDSLVSDR